jgi:transposase-like protein
MTRRYKNHSPTLKLKVAIEAAQNQKTVNQIASENGVAAVQVTEWKKQLLEEGAQVFQNKRRANNPEAHEDVNYLQQQIGKLTAQIEWFKKKQGITP